jgi:pyruvate kinase
MKPKIFITPWRDLADEGIKFCIAAGADSARIHTGKLTQAKINSLISFYAEQEFKFYLDLTGNKPRVNSFQHYGTKQEFNLGETVVVYTKHSTLPDIERDHDLELDFFPCVLKTVIHGDLNVDDGKLSFEILESNLKNGELNYILCRVANAEQHLVEHKDGVSSSNINIHSHEDYVLIRADIEFLLGIPEELQDKVKFIVLSFCESTEQIIASVNLIKKLGFRDFQIVPKIETMVGVENIDQISKLLHEMYGVKAELQIGRGDLSLDCVRSETKYDLNQQVDKIIEVSHKNHVQVSVLAMILQSSRKKFKNNRLTQDLSPSAVDREYIQHLCQKQVMQIGLTNETYIDQPERMVTILKQIIN